MIIKENYPNLDDWYINEIYDEMQADGESLKDIDGFLRSKDRLEYLKHAPLKRIDDILYAYDDKTQNWDELTLEEFDYLMKFARRSFDRRGNSDDYDYGYDEAM